MAITFNLELNGKPNKKGCYSIFIRITEDRKAHKVKTSVELPKKADWNSKAQKIRSSEKNAAAWNDTLAKELEAAVEEYRKQKQEGKLATAAEVAKVLKGKGEAKTLLAYTKEVRAFMLSKNKLGNWKKYGSFEKLLESFLTSSRGTLEDIALASLTPAKIDEFEAFLRKQPNARAQAKLKAQAKAEGKKSVNLNDAEGLNPNTINKLMRCFRAIVNKAIEEEGALKPENNPFRTRNLKDISVTKEKLTAEEIKALEEVELEEGSAMWNARNAFLLSFYCAGIRVSDIIQLKWANIKNEEGEARLSYQMGKNNKEKNIILVRQAQEILLQYAKEGRKPSDFIFPFLDNKAKYAKANTLAERKALPVRIAKDLFDEVNAREVQINRALRKVAALAGIEKHISFHISRHSFAKAAKEAHTDNALLKGLMNHSSLSVTEGYMREFDTTKEDEALKQIFEKREESKEDALLQQLKGLDKKTLAALLLKLNEA